MGTRHDVLVILIDLLVALLVVHLLHCKLVILWDPVLGADFAQWLGLGVLHRRFLIWALLLLWRSRLTFVISFFVVVFSALRVTLGVPAGFVSSSRLHCRKDLFMLLENVSVPLQLLSISIDFDWGSWPSINLSNCFFTRLYLYQWVLDVVDQVIIPERLMLLFRVLWIWLYTSQLLRFRLIWRLRNIVACGVSTS